MIEPRMACLKSLLSNDMEAFSSSARMFVPSLKRPDQSFAFLSIQPLHYSRVQQRHHYLVMTRKPESPSAAHCGTPDHVSNRPVMLYEVHVDRGKIPHLMPEISRKR